jgi:Domain of Unknown Function (DUF1080)
MRFAVRCALRSFALLAAIMTVNASFAADDDFKPLFNGKDFSGWRKYMFSKDNPKPDLEGNWKIVDGVIQCAGGLNGYFITEKDYENYVLKLKWKYPANITEKVKRPNSGVLVHTASYDWIWPLSIEIQLANQQAGDIYLMQDKEKKYPKLEVDASRKDPKSERHFFKMGAKDKSFEKPLGEWNEYEITCKGGDITIKVNGQLANEAKNGSLKKGKIAFQSEGAEIHFKDIVIKELK